MREQAIAQKVGNRTGIGTSKRSSSNAQRPARRSRGGEGAVDRLRHMLRYLPIVLKLAIALVVTVALFQGYRSAASASFFQIHEVEVQGTSRTSIEEIQTLVRREVGKTGVWNADLNEIQRKLERLPWVRSAIVTRVLPDGIRVRVVERQPRAIVRTSSGRFRWVDDDAVMLGEMNSTDQVKGFFLRGLSEDETEVAHQENVERVRRFLQLQRECDVAGISDRISEINLSDLRDMRAQLAGNDSEIEVRLGSQDPGKHLVKGLEVLDTQRQTPRGQLISYVDLSQGQRAVIGFSTGARAAAVNKDVVATAEDRGVANVHRREEKKKDRAEKTEKKDTRGR